MTALLVIDMQAGLLQRDVFKKQELLDNTNALIAKFNDCNQPVFLIRHTNESFSKINTDEWQVDNRILQTGVEILFSKSHSSVFKEKKFVEILQEMNVGRIVVCGLVTNGCVQTVCLDGLKLGFEVFLADGAHSTWHKDAEKSLMVVVILASRSRSFSRLAHRFV